MQKTILSFAMYACKETAISQRRFISNLRATRDFLRALLVFYSLVSSVAYLDHNMYISSDRINGKRPMPMANLALPLLQFFKFEIYILLKCTLSIFQFLKKKPLQWFLKSSTVTIFRTCSINRCKTLCTIDIWNKKGGLPTMLLRYIDNFMGKISGFVRSLLSWQH